MAYLDVSPMIVALRTQASDFELSRGCLRYLDRYCYRSGHSGHWLCHVFQNWDSRTCKAVFDDDTAVGAGPSAYSSTGACAKTLEPIQWASTLTLPRLSNLKL
jgi:hypothetical protein